VLQHTVPLYPYLNSNAQTRPQRISLSLTVMIARRPFGLAVGEGDLILRITLEAGGFGAAIIQDGQPEAERVRIRRPVD
jgi:hypothetical protein